MRTLLRGFETGCLCFRGLLFGASGSLLGSLAMIGESAFDSSLRSKSSGLQELHGLHGESPV